MTAPVSTNTTIPQQPIGAYTLNGSNRFDAGNFVVNPPSQFYKYSVYDEIKLGEDKFKEILGNLHTKTAQKNLKRDKRKALLSKIINWGIVIGGGILLYKFRKPVKNAFSAFWNKMSEILKKK